MLKALHRPLSSNKALIFAAVLVGGTALYCLAYTALLGVRESPVEGSVWAIVHILPWFGAFELAKRVRGPGPRLACLLGALAGSLLLQVGAYGLPSGLGFELVRRLPAFLLTAALLGLGGMAARLEERRAHPTAAADLPLAPSQIEWVSAAGNYVELHAGGRTVLHRAPLAAIERQFAPYGFLRIHRSTLVRRDCIGRVRPLDVLLRDGTSLKTGKRFRAALDDL